MQKALIYGDESAELFYTDRVRQSRPDTCRTSWMSTTPP